MDQNTILRLIGDTPVSEQIASALERMASKDYVYRECATHDEVEDLKRKIEMLMCLVGDTSVANQISAALNNIK